MKLPKVSFPYKVYAPLVALFLILTLALPRQAKFAYDYRKGSPWDHETLIAQFDFPILKTDEQIREDRSRNSAPVIPYYRFRQDVVDNGKRAIESLDLGSSSSLRPALLSAMDAIWSSGVVSDEGVKVDNRAGESGNAVLYIQKGKRVTKKPVDEVYKESEAKSRLLSEVSSRLPGKNVDSVLRATGVYDLVAPDLEYDARTTDLVNQENASKISTTQGFVSAGQLIVSEGEMVTAEIEQMLDSYKAEFEENLGYSGSKLVFWLGNALLSFVMVFLFLLVIYYLNPAVLKSLNKFYYLIFIFLFTALMTLAVNKYAPKFLYMAPFALAALYLEAFFRNKMIMPFCCVAFLPLLIFASNGVVLFVMFIIASQVAVLAFKHFNHGWKQFIMAAMVLASLLVTYSAFRLVDMVNDNPYHAVLLMVVGSLLTVAGYTLIFLFERAFNLLSTSRLHELCDTSNPLLREFESRAPGSFQHSLQVANMAEVAARRVGANAALVRAGALYHDIGKMENPLCFIENESMSSGGSHYHQGLSPKESASAIIRHVTDGLETAARHNLPDVILDFIRSHHGTSCTGYFYNKYINEGGDPSDSSAFFYDGIRPRTKEQVILMICDTVEAASRTLKDNSQETFSAFVEQMVDSKMKMGQFADAEISIKELNEVKEVLKGYLAQIYHERIAYPGQK